MNGKDLTTIAKKLTDNFSSNFINNNDLPSASR